jgi:hypothetical protein
MPSLYVVSFESISITAVQDLLQIKCPASCVLTVKRLNFFNTNQTAPASSQLGLRARILPATVSDGSGGGTSTPAALDPGASAVAAFTCLTNNTAKATSGGNPLIVEEAGMNVLQGYDNGALDIVVAPSQSLVWELLTAPLAALTFSAMALIEQRG